MNTQTTAAVKQNTLTFINRISERVTTLSEELESLKNEVNDAAQGFPYVHTSDSIGHWIPRGNEVATIISLLKEINVNDETMQHIITQVSPQMTNVVKEQIIKTLNLKPFIETMFNEIISTISLYIEDMPDSDIAGSPYIDSERRVQFEINTDKIIDNIKLGYSDNIGYIFDRECNKFAAQGEILNFIHTTNIN
jgi:hypothetical protein